MATTLPLDGAGWELREALGESWRWYASAHRTAALNSVTAAAASVTDAAGEPGDAGAQGDASAQGDSRDPAAVASRGPWLPARVPSAVIADLVRAGEVPEPRHARDSRAAEWVADRAWVYRRPVTLPALGEDDQVVLELDGVDPGAIVFWDGVELGTVEGMFHRARLRIGAAGDAATTPGEHVLALVLPPAPPMEPQVGRTEKVTRLAPRLGYGWDFSPRLRHQGVWRSARLRWGAVQLAGVRVRAELDESLRHGRVRVGLSLDAPAGAEVPVRIELRRDETVAEVRQVLAAGDHELVVEVDDPEPWWPAGLGEPALYDVRVAAGDDDAGVRVGFRRVEWVANPGAPEGALPYTAVVNGQRVPLVGWNWAPVDTLYGEIDAARTRHLVELAARSGARLLRVWGGGLSETDEFYDACDEAGLLVWQEFSQSSSGMQSAPSEDPDFVAHAVAEAERLVPRLASHPGLVLWGGGNELEDDAGPLDDDRSPVLAALHDVVARRHPGAGWVPTSPSGPTFHHRLDRLRDDPDGQHDVHGPWEHQGLEAHYELGNAGASLAHTEFGVEGMTNRRALDAIVPAEQQWPPDRGNPVYRHLGEWWNNAELVQASFGGRLTDVDAMLRASQLLQATGLQYSIEANRRRAPRCSMVLPWQLNESFPNAWCTSAVDFFGEPKPAFHAVARAFAPERITLRVDRAAWAGHPELHAEAWLWSERERPAGSRVTLRLRDASGAVLGESAAAVGAVHHPVPAAHLRAPAPRDAVVVWDAEWHDPEGRLLDREIMIASTGSDLAPLLELESARLDVDARRVGDEWQVRVAHRAGPLVVGLGIHDARPLPLRKVAHVAKLRGADATARGTEATARGMTTTHDATAAPRGWPVHLGDPRPLLPGESRTFRIHWVDDDPDHRRLTLTAWNAPPISLFSGVDATGEPHVAPRDVTSHTTHTNS